MVPDRHVAAAPSRRRPHHRRPPGRGRGARSVGPGRGRATITLPVVPVEVVPYSPDWVPQFQRVADALRVGLAEVSSAVIEHVGSTSVPGLAAKPIIDIDVLVDENEMSAAVSAMEAIGYVHRGDLGVSDREAFTAPDDTPRRNVYVCRGAL